MFTTLYVVYVVRSSGCIQTSFQAIFMSNSEFIVNSTVFQRAVLELTLHTFWFLEKPINEIAMYWELAYVLLRIIGTLE